EVHHAPSPLAAPSAAAPLSALSTSRNLPGFGRSFGGAFFTASRTVIQPPLAPGTAPSIRIRPRSTSTCAIFRFSVVMRSWPMWPGIFLFLKVLPGSCRPPVPPIERCETDTPCEARRPPKFQRFMPPAKPLPMVVPVTSTNWPTTKWSAVISAPTGIIASALTRNSAIVRLGSTLATAKRPRSALLTFLTLRVPEPSCRATYPSFSLLRCATTWHCARRSTVTGTCSPASVKRRVIPIFCAITPERIVLSSLSRHGSELDLDIDASGEVELHQRVHGLRRRIDDVEEALMGAHLELFAALLVDVRRAVHRELLDLGRQRDRSTDLGAGALGRVDDLAGRRIENAVIERLEPDPNILAVHVLLLRHGARRSAPQNLDLTR